MQPSRKSNAIGLMFLGAAIIFSTIVVFKWQINPYFKKRRYEEAEEWANSVFEMERKEKHRDELH